MPFVEQIKDRIARCAGHDDTRDWTRGLLAFDSLPSERWSWLPEIQAYLYTPTHLPRRWRYRQYLLAWEAGFGWVLSIPDAAIRTWFPLMSPEDPRNRPDQFWTAALVVVEQYDNKHWVEVLRWLKKETKERV